MIEKLKQTREFLRSKISEIPSSAVVLGSGLADLFEDLPKIVEIPYKDIPNFSKADVKGHPGKLAVYQLKDRTIACMRGRFHYYDICDMQQTVFPYRALAYAGVENFILTNASGSLRKKFKPGSIVLMKDHINFFPSHPLMGENISDLGPRFLDVAKVYDGELRKKIKKISAGLGLKIPEGVYVGCSGPSYETPAEAKMFATLGGDVIGMSTVPEALVLHHMGKRICALSFVANYTPGVTSEEISHEDVLQNVTKAAKGAKKLVQKLLLEIR